MTEWLVPKRLSQLSSPQAGPIRLAVAAPPRSALELGFLTAVMAMGVVTIQTVVFSTRFYRDRRTLVIIVNVIALSNLINLILLGTGLYHSTIAILMGGYFDSVDVGRRYAFSLATGVISRTILSYASILLTACLFRSVLLVSGLHLLLASRSAISALALKTIYGSLSPSASTGRNLPSFITGFSMVGTVGECIVCALYFVFSFRALDDESQTSNDSPPDRRSIRHVMPAYLVTMVWQLGFAAGALFQSSFITAFFGVPLGAVSSATLLALLHAHPSAFNFRAWWQGDVATTDKPLAKACIFTTKDVTTVSCHDGTLETDLMERLERKFPCEEESRTYDVELGITVGASVDTVIATS